MRMGQLRGATGPYGVFMVGSDKGHRAPAAQQGPKGDVLSSQRGICVINSVPRLPLKIAWQPLPKEWGPEHRMEAGAVPGAGAAWEAGCLGRGLLWVLCCFPVHVLPQITHLLSRPHPSHTQPRTCLGQATELLTSLWFSTHTAGCPSPPSLGFPIHATYILFP